uniref:Citramalyl-CoA lyase, mitochondrial n=1 Tax=Plectus sambesii TaxID=2011161 RepID=A0A914WM41_9BILA
MFIRLGKRSIQQFRHFCSGTGASSSNDKYVPRRALLYVPASNPKMLDKAPKLQVDCLVLELEDGVALTAKAEARQNIRKYLDNWPQQHACHEVGVRVNSVSSGLLADDVTELAKSSKLPDAFMVPKIDSVDDLNTVWKTFRSAYGDQRIRNTPTRMVIWIESARALLDMPQILKAASTLHKSAQFFRTDAVVFGSDDYCADIGATRSNDATEIMYARQHFVACCKAYGMQAIDAVYIDYKDVEGLKKQCEQGKSWGFNGKQVIHPTQIGTVQDCFLPSAERIDWATELIKEFEQHQRGGKGAFTFRGHMIDRPLLLQAKNVVELVRNVKK